MNSFIAGNATLLYVIVWKIECVPTYLVLGATQTVKKKQKEREGMTKICEVFSLVGTNVHKWILVFSWSIQRNESQQNIFWWGKLIHLCNSTEHFLFNIFIYFFCCHRVIILYIRSHQVNNIRCVRFRSVRSIKKKKCIQSRKIRLIWRLTGYGIGNWNSWRKYCNVSQSSIFFLHHWFNKVNIVELKKMHKFPFWMIWQRHLKTFQLDWSVEFFD